MATDVKSRRMPSRRAAWTTQRWLRVSATLALVVLAALGGLGLWALNRTSALTDELVDVRSPALSTSVRLEAALVNQETGVRGYGLTGERTFLAPYKEGLADQRSAVTQLRQLVADDRQGRADL